MRNTIRLISGLVIALAAGLLVHTTASAQSAAMLSAPAPAEADPAFAEAAPLGTSKDWVTVARALEQTAKSRRAGDPRTVADLFGAGQAYYAGGKLAPARRSFVKGAEQARVIGDIDRALDGYMAALIVALELGDRDATQAAMTHVKSLAGSPLLSTEQKQRIVAQFGYGF